MRLYDKSLYDDVAQVQHGGLPSFGSGRLIGKNLILTARHVVCVKDTINVVKDDWLVRLTRDMPAEEGSTEWEWFDASVIWTSAGKLDMALLEVSAEPALTPKYRTRVAILKTASATAVQAIGYPDGSSSGSQRLLTAPPGQLWDQKRPTFTFGIEPSFEPVDPALNWKGFSGSAVVHSVVRDPSDVWIYGVAQEVPANFTRQLDVAPLAKATEDERFCTFLAAAGVTIAAPADPDFFPAAEDFPDIERIRNRAIARLTAAEVSLMETTATFCANAGEIEQIHRGGAEGRPGFAPADLLRELGDRGVLILRTPGGFGKTFYLLRLVLAAVDAGHVPFFLDLKGISETSDPGDDACYRLFGSASLEGASWRKFHEARDKRLPILVAVDSLNEATTSKQIERILKFLAETFSDKLFLVIADRLSDDTEGLRGRLGTMLPLSTAQVDDRLKQLKTEGLGDSFKKLLSIPFFLGLYEKICRHAEEAARQDFRNRSEILYAYFAICHDSTVDPARMKSYGKEIVRKLAPIAFEGYRDQSIVMPEPWFAEQLAKNGISIDALRKAGMLVPDNGNILFSHQLFHDFLAGYHLADPDDPVAAPSRWRSTNFDIASLKAKSFDALDFAVELAENRADQLIIEVYDWNYGGALRLVLKSERDFAAAAPANWQALRDALIILNSEKQFDAFQHTRLNAKTRAEFVAQVISTEFNRHDFASLQELLDTARAGYNHQGLYAIWKDVFVLSEKAKPSLWGLLQHSPLVAWTAANAFRRKLEDGDELLDYLEGLYDSLFERQPLDDFAIGTRWRIVHIFGKAGRDEIIERLFAAVDREGKSAETQWIQYGAVRSLVEIAGRKDAAGGELILTRLRGMMGAEIAQRSRAFGELREVALLVEQPPWWPAAYSPILEKGADLETSPDEREAWIERLRELKGS
jgi:Trypsin-like peptidase domain